jgi:hypothetical protein
MLSSEKMLTDRYHVRQPASHGREADRQAQRGLQEFVAMVMVFNSIGSASHLRMFLVMLCVCA